MVYGLVPILHKFYSSYRYSYVICFLGKASYEIFLVQMCVFGTNIVGRVFNDTPYYFITIIAQWAISIGLGILWYKLKISLKRNRQSFDGYDYSTYM